MTDELLLILQDLRLSLPDIVTSAMLVFSSPLFHVAIPLALATYYLWCSNRRDGEWFAMNVICGLFFGHLLKDIIKNPRPWLADDRLIPCSEAIDSASGYSTPSGHSVDSVTSYGTLILILRRRWGTILLSALMILIMFSRLFLGVHTLADLIVGILLGAAIIAINGMTMRYSFSDEGNYLRASVLYALAIITAMLIWVLVSDDNSTLIDYVGLMLGTLIARPAGYFLVGFDGNKMTKRQKLVGLVIGWSILLLLFGIPYVLLEKSMAMVIGGFLIPFGMFILVPSILGHYIN